MPPEGPSGSHLDPTNWIHGVGGLGQCRVTGGLPALPDSILQGLGLLPQLIQFVHVARLVWRFVLLVATSQL